MPLPKPANIAAGAAGQQQRRWRRRAAWHVSKSCRGRYPSQHTQQCSDWLVQQHATCGGHRRNAGGALSGLLLPAARQAAAVAAEDASLLPGTAAPPLNFSPDAFRASATSSSSCSRAVQEQPWPVWAMVRPPGGLCPDQASKPPSENCGTIFRASCDRAARADDKAAAPVLKGRAEAALLPIVFDIRILLHCGQCLAHQ